MTALSVKIPVSVPLHDLFIAPENVRAEHGTDDDEHLTDLASSLLTGGQILPLFVRAAPDMIRPWAVLDGRRRLLALQNLEHDGDIPSDYGVQVVVCETPEEIAAATLVANDQRLELTHADYLLAVHKLSHQFKSAEDIGRILGLETKRVRQLAKLGSLDKRFLDAYRDEDIRLPTLKKLAKIKDPDIVAKLAAQLEETGVLYEHHVYNATSDDIVVTVNNNLVQFVTIEAYLADGGTVEQDMFDETPDTITDVPRLHRLWTEKVKPIADALRDQGLTVTVNPDHILPDGVTTLDWRWKEDLTQAEAIRLAQDAANEAAGLSRASRLAGDPTWSDKAIVWANRSLDKFTLEAAPLTVTAAGLKATNDGGLKLTFGVERDAYEAHIAAAKALAASPASAGDPSKPSGEVGPPAVPVKIDTEGFQHLLHMKVTELAGDALAVTLADAPEIAFDLQLTTQFRSIINERVYNDEVLKLTANGSVPSDSDPLHKGIALRLKAYRDGYRASKLHMFEWVRTLDGEAKADLLALITACMISTREEKTNAIRPKTRAEAALVAAAMDHSFADVWLPDETFYVQFTKKQLLGFLDAMGTNSPEAKKASRDELAPIVTAYATAKRFVPPQLNFELAVEPIAVEPLAAQTEEVPAT